MLSGFTGEILSELVDEPQAEVACVVINDFDGNVCNIDIFSLQLLTHKGVVLFKQLSPVMKGGI